MNLAALPWWLDVLLSVLVLAGAGFALVGAWALARWQDFFHRLHGPSKATTLGVGAVLIAAALYFAWQGSWSFAELLVTVFLSLTAPVSAHLLVQAARRG
jgi:multicomponent K+:H+ antiporter subunit G